MVNATHRGHTRPTFLKPDNAEKPLKKLPIERLHFPKGGHLGAVAFVGRHIEHLDAGIA